MDDLFIENRGVATQEEAEAILNPHLPILWECLNDAWQWVQNLLTWDADARQTLMGRSRACIMYERATRLIEQRFNGMTGIRLARQRGFLQVVFNERLSLRFKKLRPGLRSSNVRTNAQRNIYFQHEFENFPPAATELTLGYLTDKAWMQIDGAFITCPVSWDRLKWSMPLLPPASGAQPVLEPLPQPELPLIRAKNAKGTKKAM
jgi:hypothetical protein